MDERIIESLIAAVHAAPADQTLRLHLAEGLLSAGRTAEAIQHAAILLAADPGLSTARDLISRAMGTGTHAPPGDQAPIGDQAPGKLPEPASTPASGDFDWHAAETDLGDIAAPMFVNGSSGAQPPSPYGAEQTSIRLGDVGGLENVKKRLEASFLAPMRSPELRQLYGTSLRGGLLLYGPPGCGKTFIARAISGELGASFLHVSLADILDMYLGQSERNMHELFEVARESAPCVLFLDELDAIGQKRSQTRNSAIRTTVNQLLTELDGIGSMNDGVYLLAATNHPWDVDPALLRPGRLDRMLLVVPPDLAAREAILRSNTQARAVEGINLSWLAKATDGFSGADLAHLCESAAEIALMDSVESGIVRMIGMADFEHALGEIRSSVGPWIETARNVALYANSTGQYDELVKWLRKHGK